MQDEGAGREQTSRREKGGRGKREDEEEDEYITIGDPAGGEYSCDSSRLASIPHSN